MALTLSSLQTEVLARGLGDMTAAADTTRITRWINDAMHLIDELADWPYLLATNTPAAAPLTIADLRTVQCVTTVGNLSTLAPIDRRVLRDSYGDLTTVGTPLFYYFTAPTTIAVYPTSTSTTLTVDYWKFGPDLSAAGDAPLMPDRFRMSIVHYAVSQGLADRGDVEGSARAKQDGSDVVGLMRESLLSPQHQQADQWVPAYGEDL